MGNRFYKRKGVGSRKGRMAGIVNPQNYTVMNGWVLMCTDYPDKEFNSYKDYLQYVESLKPKEKPKTDTTKPKTTKTTATSNKTEEV